MIFELYSSVLEHTISFLYVVFLKSVKCISTSDSSACFQKKKKKTRQGRKKRFSVGRREANWRRKGMNVSTKNEADGTDIWGCSG